MKDRWHYGDIHLNSPVEAIPVPIISDAGVATVGTADGRLLPLIIIDSSSRPDIENAINVHQHTPPGDVQSSWAKLSKRGDKICLVLNFIEPCRCIVLLEFDISGQGGLVDLIIQMQGLYLQCGQQGDRLVTTLNHARILVEVPSKAFQDRWDKMFRDTLVKGLRKKGSNRFEAKISADALIKDWREINLFRMKKL